MKLCRKCNTEKPLTEFYKNYMTKDGYQHFCKQCVCKRQARYDKDGKNREYAKNKATVSKRKYRIAEWQAVLDRGNYTCEQCGGIDSFNQFEVAHIIDDTVPNNKLFGYYFINNRANLKLTHKVSTGAPCNSDARVKTYSPEYREHIVNVVMNMQGDERIKPHIVTESLSMEIWEINGGSK